MKNKILNQRLRNTDKIATDKKITAIGVKYCLFSAFHRQPKDKEIKKWK
jgi:hypothetical protein